MGVDWNEIFKIKLSTKVDESMDKHDVIKLLMVRKLLREYRQRSWIRIYTEFRLENGLIPDIYFENIKSKSIIIYEIQKQFGKKWLKEKTKQYNSLIIPFFDTIDFIPIDIKKCPDKINEINNWLDKYIF